MRTPSGILGANFLVRDSKESHIKSQVLLVRAGREEGLGTVYIHYPRFQSFRLDSRHSSRPDGRSFVASVRLAVPARAQLRITHLRSRTARALRKSQADHSRSADADWHAKYSVVAERKEQE